VAGGGEQLEFVVGSAAALLRETRASRADARMARVAASSAPR
jgi:hypothetical protein